MLLGSRSLKHCRIWIVRNFYVKLGEKILITEHVCSDFIVSLESLDTLIAGLGLWCQKALSSHVFCWSHAFFSGEGKPESHFQDCFSTGRGTAQRRESNIKKVILLCTPTNLWPTRLHYSHSSPTKMWAAALTLPSNGSTELQGHHGDGRASEENHRALWH